MFRSLRATAFRELSGLASRSWLTHQVTSWEPNWTIPARAGILPVWRHKPLRVGDFLPPTSLRVASILSVLTSEIPRPRPQQCARRRVLKSALTAMSVVFYEKSTAVAGGAFQISHPRLLRKQFHSMRHQVRSNVGVEHHDQTDDRTQSDRVPDHEAKDHAFVADLVGGRGGHADRLRVHHLAHHATGAVGRG